MSQDGRNAGPVIANVQGGKGEPSDNVGAYAVTGGYSWRNRRRMMWSAAIFCKITVGYVVVSGASSSVAETAVVCSFLCLGSIVGSYVFGAAWQDVTHIRMGK